MSIAKLNDLHAFATVARLRSFRQAAQALNVSPSALSHALRTLEARLGVRLLNRTTRSVAPTEAGQGLLDRLAPALGDIAAALDEINTYRQSPIGTLRINAPRAAVEFVLAPLAGQFLRENPGMRLELVADNRFVDIVAEGFDAGVRFGERLAQDMVAVPIGPPQRFMVVAAPAYLAECGSPTHPKELATHRCIRQRHPSGKLLNWYFQRGSEKLSIEISGPITVSDMGLAIGPAKDGIGLAFVYEQMAAPLIAQGQLVSVLDDWRPAETGFFLYYSSRRLVPAGLRAFIELAHSHYPGNTPP